MEQAEIPKESIEYPFLRNDLTKELIYNKFNDLLKFKPTFSEISYENASIRNIPDLNPLELCYLQNGKPKALINYPDYWTKYNLITSYFSERCMIHSKRFDVELTAKEYWDTNKGKLVQNLIEQQLPITNANLADQMYLNYIGPTYFNITNVCGIIDLLGGKCILDFCAGWGDRLIGSLVRDADFYCGVDPNSCLHTVYPEIVNFFQRRTEVKMIESPFETAEIPDKNYDLILTSPPFFTLEEYSPESTQSIIKYGNLEDWYNNFLLFSLKKAWSYLKPGGHMAIYINDISLRTLKSKQSIKYTERMIQDVNLFPDSLYLGVLMLMSLKNNKPISPQPLWIWHKNVIPVNPPFNIAQYDEFNVIDDGVLMAGTKQRAMNFLTNIDSDFLFTGNMYGMQIVYHALAAKIAKKKIYAYFDFKYFRPDCSAILRARMLGINILPKTGKNIPGLYIVPSAHTDNIIKNLLIKEFENHADQLKQITTIWIPESMCLADALMHINPNIQIIMVLICNKTNVQNMKTYRALESCYEPARYPPKYESVPMWDAKVWAIAKKNGKKGDWIFNTGAL